MRPCRCTGAGRRAGGGRRARRCRADGYRADAGTPPARHAQPRRAAERLGLGHQGGRPDRTRCGAGGPTVRRRRLVGRGGPPGAITVVGVEPAVYRFPQQASGVAVTGFTGRTLLAAVAGLAVALAATSLSALLEGLLWWGAAALAIAVVVA